MNQLNHMFFFSSLISRLNYSMKELKNIKVKHTHTHT